jgi:hypothetical protein
MSVGTFRSVFLDAVLVGRYAYVHAEADTLQLHYILLRVCSGSDPTPVSAVLSSDFHTVRLRAAEPVILLHN